MYHNYYLFETNNNYRLSQTPAIPTEMALEMWILIIFIDSKIYIYIYTNQFLSTSYCNHLYIHVFQNIVFQYILFQ